MAELALRAAAEAPSGAREARLWDEVLELRDLLRFESFFQDREEFRVTFAAELNRFAPGRRDHLARGPEGIVELLDAAETVSSDTMLRAFLEAYGVVADELAALGDAPIGPQAAFLAGCETRGARYVAEQRVRNPEAVSRHLSGTRLELARNRGLAEADADLARRRAEFASRLAAVTDRMATVRRVAVGRLQRLTGRDAAAGSTDGRAAGAAGKN